MDTSQAGIAQMEEKAIPENLLVKGIVADIYDFKDYKSYDIILLDSMFHFAKKDYEKEAGLVLKIAAQIRVGALLCVCIQDISKKAKVLKQIIAGSKSNWEVLNDTLLLYYFEDKESGQQSETRYCMYVVKKKLIS